MKPEAKHRVLTKLLVRCYTNFGESLVLVGNIPELGSWNPIDAVILTATTFSESNPIWETQNPLSLPTNVPIEYKFVKMTTGSMVWEELPNGMNHTLLLDQQQDLEIHHCFGEAGKEILRLERDRRSSPLEDSKTSTEKIKKSIIPEYRTGANAASEKEKTEPPITMTGEDVVIFVLHILPLVITKKEDKYEYTHSRRILYPSLFRLSELNVVQIKWVGLITTQDYSNEEQEKIRTDLEKFGIYPVFIEKKILEDFTYYYDYVIFPLFHNFVSYRKNVDLSNARYHQAYITVNQIFVETIVSIKKKIPKAMVLFNDPYFLLAPRILAKENLNNHIGYFFHSPFPSGEIFRVLPHCKECMKSLLHCDTIGFQLYEYARHFFTSCQRLLGLEAEARRGGSLGILYQGRDVLISVRHIGITRDQIKEIMEQEEFKEETKKLESKVKNKYSNFLFQRLSCEF